MITSHKHNVFVARVLERDNFECQHCYTKTNLHIHHIKKVKTNPDLQYEVNNGITLCSKCHKIFENWVDAPWNKRLCWNCDGNIPLWEKKDTVPFMQLWSGKKWLIREVSKKVCRK